MPGRAKKTILRRLARWPVRKWLSCPCFVLVVLLIFLVAYKSKAAPFPIHAYLRGTFLLATSFLFLGMLIFPFMRRVLGVGVCSAFLVVGLFLLVNQVLAFFLAVQSFAAEAVFLLQAIILFSLLMGEQFLWRRIFRPNRSRVLAKSLLQAIMVSTFLAFLLKLESYPDALPYQMPAAMVTLWVPILYWGVVIALGHLQKHRELVGWLARAYDR